MPLLIMFTDGGSIPVYLLQIFDNFYGTSKDSVNYLLKKNNDILFDIDWQGTQQLDRFKELNLIKIFEGNNQFSIFTYLELK